VVVLGRNSSKPGIELERLCAKKSDALWHLRGSDASGHARSAKCV
jgi:hypothetical protein